MHPGRRQVLVEQVLAHVALRPLQLADVVGQDLLAIDLLLQEVGLDEIAQIGIRLLAGQGVQVEQVLVHLQLHPQGVLESLQRAGEAGQRLGNAVQHDQAAALVHVLHDLLRMLTLLHACLQKESVQARATDVRPVEVVGLREAEASFRDGLKIPESSPWPGTGGRPSAPC